ncbi:MAG: TssQ family T6SS-associated lipoprotein [Herminiimonas sp.]|nr:TssQ family T6SS-associated lipoprotein [Herminiimonas sp.]
MVHTLNRGQGRTSLATAGGLISGLLLVLLQGCAAPGAPVVEPVVAASAPAKPAARPGSVAAGADKRDSMTPESAASQVQQTLAAGIELYNKGDFNGAIKRLGNPDVAAADKATQIAALKYSAFSYCVTKRQTLCRQQFVKAFKLDPGFELAPGEKGHPLWSAAFERAKRAR